MEDQKLENLLNLALDSTEEELEELLLSVLSSLSESALSSWTSTPADSCPTLRYCVSDL